MAKNDPKAAVAGVIAGAVAGDVEVEQLELLPPMRMSMTADEETKAVESVKRDRAGRPPGARNVATREMLDFVRKAMGDPLERRFRWAMHTPESLAAVLGCTKLEAFDRLDKMWADLARYFYAQQAQVDSKGNTAVPRLTMVVGGQYAAQIGQDGAPLPPWLYLRDQAPQTDAETQQNQALLASPDDGSHGQVSHVEEN